MCNAAIKEYLNMLFTTNPIPTVIFPVRTIIKFIQLQLKIQAALNMGHNGFQMYLA